MCTGVPVGECPIDICLGTGGGGPVGGGLDTGLSGVFGVGDSDEVGVDGVGDGVAIGSRLRGRDGTGGGCLWVLVGVSSILLSSLVGVLPWDDILTGVSHLGGDEIPFEGVPSFGGRTGGSSSPSADSPGLGISVGVLYCPLLGFKTGGSIQVILLLDSFLGNGGPSSPFMWSCGCCRTASKTCGGGVWFCTRGCNEKSKVCKKLVWMMDKMFNSWWYC